MKQKKITDEEAGRGCSSSALFEGVVVKTVVVRPKNSKDKTLHPGMRLFAAGEGRIEARHRAPKGGGRLIGHVIAHEPASSSNAIGEARADNATPNHNQTI
jgi:hypothetical protein